MAAWLIPTIGVLIASFRTAADTNRGGWWTALVPPYEFTFQNYDYVLSRGGFWDSFLNSFVITIPATALVVMVAAFAAYAFAWMNFRGRNVLFVVVVGLLVVPLQVTLIPVLTLFRDFRIGGFELNGTILAVWLAHTGYGLPFARLPAAQLHGWPAQVGVRGRGGRRCGPGHRVLPARAADEHSRHRGADDLPVPLGVERPAHRPGLPRARARRTIRSR